MKLEIDQSSITTISINQSININSEIMKVGKPTRFCLYLSSFLLIIGGICIISAGVHQYNLDPNRVAYAYHRNDGLTSDNTAYDSRWYSTRVNMQGALFGSPTVPRFYGGMFSCSAIASGFNKNEYVLIFISFSLY